MKRLVAVVHYFTPQLAAAAVQSVVQTWSTRRAGDEVLLIDNGCSADTLGTLERLPAVLRTGHGNLGYAGAVNLAMDMARDGGADECLVLNADVRVEQRCVDELFAELEQGTAVCGPSFYWDDELEIHLPPSQSAGLVAACVDLLAQKSRLVAGVARRRFRAVAQRHWCARAPMESWRLSGALLGLRCDAFRQVGPFDEEYALYFEETDWLVRARRHGVRARYVPSARAVHHYDQSPDGGSGRKAALFEASALRFRRRHYGVAGGLLALLARLPEAQAPRAPRKAPGETAWVEWSPRACGFPMAGRKGQNKALPESVRLRDLQEGLYQRCVDASGKELEISLAPAS